MSKLVFSLDNAFLGDYPLDKERITIGRRPTNDIHIDNLVVSGEHAVVVTIGNDSFLEDLESSNGTLVSGRPIKKHVLQHGDVIEIGKYQLKYVAEAAVNVAAMGSSPEDFEKTMIIRPSAMKPVAPAMEVAASMQSINVQMPSTIPTAASPCG
jgi:pSer/pThr/pTyr-binding forkhead associated (FHA) protein